jgi:hypothetical protein
MQCIHTRHEHTNHRSSVSASGHPGAEWCGVRETFRSRTMHLSCQRATHSAHERDRQAPSPFASPRLGRTPQWGSRGTYLSIRHVRFETVVVFLLTHPIMSYGSICYFQCGECDSRETWEVLGRTMAGGHANCEMVGSV